MLIQKIKQGLSNPYIRNVGWLGNAELVNRISRLATTVVLARVFSESDYGIVAIIFTVQSFTEVVASGAGMGVKIIQADEDKVEHICNTVYWLNWILCGLMCLLQWSLAYPIAYFFGNQAIALPIGILALKYLTIPFYKVHASLTKRNNNLKIVALVNALQSVGTNAITILLALNGLGVWAVVIAAILTTPISIITFGRYSHWKSPRSFSLYYWKDVLEYGTGILGIRLLDRLRLNLDYLIVGRYLGLEQLGLYYFAFNAGIGMSQNFINTFTISLLPYLCAVRSDHETFRHRYISSLKNMGTIVIPFVLLQTALAPLYVPFIFGQQWTSAIPILMIICLSAIPIAFTQSTAQLLNALDKVRINLIWNLIFTLLFGAILLITSNFGILYLAISVLACQSFSGVFSLWISRKLLKKQLPLLDESK